MNAKPRHFLYLICLWLSAFTVAAHAMAPVGSPIAKRSGSAFSTSTYEVSLVPTRAAPAKAARDLGDGSNGEDEPGADGVAAAILPSLSLPLTAAISAQRFARRTDARLPAAPPNAGFRARAPPTA